MIRGASFAFASLLLFALACGPRYVPVVPHQQTLSTATESAALVEAGVLQALTRLRIYSVEQQSPGQILARGEHRGRVWRVAIAYDASQVQVQYVDSQNLAYAQSPSGPVISPYYDRYVERLVHTIDRETTRVARAGGATAPVVAGAQPTTAPAAAPAPAGGDQVVVLTPREACVNEVANAGHNEDMQAFCNDALEPMCTAALLRMGHSPDQLAFCQGVDGACAQSFLEAGGAPMDLSRCALQ